MKGLNIARKYNILKMFGFRNKFNISPKELFNDNFTDLQREISQGEKVIYWLLATRKMYFLLKYHFQQDVIIWNSKYNIPLIIMKFKAKL